MCAFALLATLHAFAEPALNVQTSWIGNTFGFGDGAWTQINITALGCAEQFKLGYFNFLRRVRDRRFVAVDREHGLVTVIAEADEPAGKYATFNWVAVDMKAKYFLLDQVTFSGNVPLAIIHPKTVMGGPETSMTAPGVTAMLRAITAILRPGFRNVPVNLNMSA